jgi:hypothetical protein
MIDRKLANGEYQNPKEFIFDVRNVWIRAAKYMKDNPPVYNKAKELSQNFESMVRDLENSPLKETRPTNGDPIP